jgi:hypothetical protein
MSMLTWGYTTSKATVRPAQFGAEQESQVINKGIDERINDDDDDDFTQAKIRCAGNLQYPHYASLRATVASVEVKCCIERMERI